MRKEFQRQHIPTARIPELYRVKWPVGLLAEGFVPFPKTAIRAVAKILEGPGSMEELAVLLAVIDYKRPAMNRLPSIDYLAFASGFSVDETDQILSRLVEKELITIEIDNGLDIDPQGFFTKIADLALSDIGRPNASTEGELPDSF